MSSAVQRLVIVGAGGHGRETLDVVEAINAAGAGPRYEVLGFFANEADDELLARRGATRLGGSHELLALLLDPAHADVRYHLGIGSSATRSRIDADLDDAGVADRAETLVHPRATTGSDLRLGPGVFLAVGAVVTTNVDLGRHTHLNVNAVVSHDCVIGDHVTLSPGVLVNGNVTIGESAFLGSGAVVLPGRSIGAQTKIAAGAVVSTSVPAGVTAIGVPARW